MATPAPRGTTLLDLVTAIPQGAHELIPKGLSRFLELLSVVSSTSYDSGNYDVVEGTARSVVDAVGIDIGEGFTAEIPGVTHGLRFTYASNRVLPTGNQNLEPQPVTWQVTLYADRLLVPMPGIAAQRAVTTDGFVGPLVADPDRERVHLWISGAILIGNASGSVQARLVADPDPFQPDGPSGQILTAGLEPRHVLFGPAGFGMTMGEVLWDQTTAYTPPEIVARGHDAAWRGISVQDATLYLPRDLPFLGDVTAGVRDLLIGFRPDNGVQLEAFLQMGETSRLDVPDGDAHKVTLHFYQDVDGQLLELDIPPGPGTEREVEVESTTAGDPARVLARLFPPEAQARWRLPGSTTWTTANDTGWMVVRPGDPHDTLGYKDIFTLEDGRSADGPQITFAFNPRGASEDDTGFPPKIRLYAEPFSWSDVTHVSGTPDLLAGIFFEAIDPLPADPDDRDRFTWQLDHAGASIAGTGDRFEPSVTWQAGRHQVVLTDHEGRRRRLEVEVIDIADRMVIGCAFIDGAAPADERRGPRLLVEEQDEPAVPTAVVGSYHLRSFHQQGTFRPSDEPTTLRRGTPPGLTIPDGTLAELTLADEGDAGSHVLSAMRMRMAFDTADPVLYREIHPVAFTTDEPGFEGTHVDPWGPPDPYPVWDPDDPVDPTTGTADRLRGFPEGTDPNVAAAAVMRQWAAQVLELDPTARFVIIGRTCDIGADSYNTELGGRRAAQGRALLTDPALGPDAVAASLVYSRGENQDAGAAVGTMPDDPTILDELDDEELRARSLAERTRQEIRIKVDHADRLDDFGDDRAVPEREEARGFDVYAVVPSPFRPTLDDADAVAAARRRTLVPGADQWAWVTEAPRERDLGFAFRLLSRWDSPSWADAQDSAPTLVEVAFDWENATLAVPVLEGEIEPEATDPPEPGETKVWQVILRFSRDPRTRQMLVSGSLDTPGTDEGIARVVDDGSGIESDLALMLALGPALATGVDPGDAVESVVPLAALGGVFLASAAFDLAANGVITLHRLEFGYGRAAGGGGSATAAHRICLYADYSAGFDLALPAGLVTGRGVVIRYRRAGVEVGLEGGSGDLDSLGLVYEEAAEIVSPGTWEMNNTLARLLGVAAVRMGAGSIWIEVDLAPAIDLGPVRLDEATLRLTMGVDIVFELRNLTISVVIPGVLYGQGHLAITEGESGSLAVSAALQMAIEPIGLAIKAAFRYEQPMAHLEVAVMFATAIPILGTGLGLFGLSGRFVSNGTRNLLSAEDEPDPVQRELAWFETDLDEKYDPLKGQNALGLGAVVGTQPDAGFTFNLNGMLVVEFPDPSVVLTVAGAFMSLPGDAQESPDEGTATSVGLLGIVAISGEGIAVGIRGTYSVPELIDVQVPVAAWFPFQGDEGCYVRVGADGYEGRSGDPVTVTVLPGTLDLRAWSYLMIEEKELPNLGGKGDEWDFTGFSIGFGAGYDFEWGGSAVYLRAGSSIVVGLGTKPLFIKGELATGGELRFGPVGVSIEGNVLLTLTKDDAQLSGEFCGEVDLALFKAKGCVEITIGNVAPPPVDAEPLVSEVSLSDRHARVVAKARDTSAGGTTGAAHTAWVDCRPVLHFSKRVVLALEGDSFRPTPSGGWGADWSGSARTKFLFRLRGVELVDDDGDVVRDARDWPSTWWLPAGRPAIPAEGEPPSSEHEAWDLALLTWDLAPWARSLSDGGADTEGDPATVVERLCDPVPQTTEHCLFGADGVPLEPGRVRFAAAPTGPLPWRSGASLTGTETLGVPLDAALVWAELMGYRYEPSRVVPLPAPWDDPDADSDATVRRAWLLPRYTHATREPLTVGLDATYSQSVEDPDLVVALSVGIPRGAETEVCLLFEEFGDHGSPLPEVIDYTVARLTGQTQIYGPGYMAGFDGQLNVDIGGQLGGITFGPASRVAAKVVYHGSEPIGMRAFDADGALLGEATLPANVSPDVPYWLTLTRRGIARVELWADPTPPGETQILLIDTLCLQLLVTVDQDAAVQNLVEYFEEFGELVAPACTGVRASDERRWEATLMDVVSSADRAAAILRYQPEAADSGPWTGVRLAATPTLDVAIVSSCFTTTSAVEAAEATEAARQDILERWNGTWDGDEEERVVLLDAGRRWQVRVTYDVAEWNQDGDGGPPSAGTLDWDDPPASVAVAARTQTFEFATAAEGTMEAENLLRFDVQDVFDPRALARYVIGFDPQESTPRHFLNDMLLVHFEVEWVQTLLEKYDLELSLVVVRTDPPPGTSTGFEDRVVASRTTFTSNTSTMQSSTANARVAVAALLAPCVEGPQPHGVIANVQADLDPLAEYDLIVQAVPAGKPTAQGQVIARSHFATSAYRNANELFAALGFDPGGEPDTVFCLEQLVDSPVPTDVRLSDDVALDEALTLLGLDPLPVPDTPTSLLLWVFDGDWKVAGLLLDSLEAMERAPALEDVLDDSPPTGPTITDAAVLAGNRFVASRYTLTGQVVDYVEPPARLAVVAARVGSTELVPRRSNGSATRILLAPDAPFIPPNGDPILELEWSDRGRAVRGSRYLSTVPRLVSQEWT